MKQLPLEFFKSVAFFLGHPVERNNAVSLHQRNLQLLLVEIFKTKENLNPSFMKDIFVERMENYNLRSGNTLQLPKTEQQHTESNLYHF